MTSKLAERIGFWVGIVITLFVMACVLYSAIANAGAPIPPQWGGYYAPPVVRNVCLETYYADKSFACDRIKKDGFQ